MRRSRPMSSGAIKEKGRDDGCCGVEFLKYVLYIFNIMFWISGLVILGIGLWTFIDKHHYVSLLSSVLYSATTFLLLGTGAAIIFIGFLGCCGAIKENRICLLIYACALMVIFVMEAVSGMFAYIYEANVEDEILSTLNKTMLNNYKIDDEKTEAIDLMQQSFHCCGAGSFVDWKYSRWLQGTSGINNTAPDSCCKSMSLGCAVSNHPSNIYYHGCVYKLEMYVKEHLIIVGAVGLGVCSLQLFGIVFACCFAAKIKQWESRQMALAWIG